MYMNSYTLWIHIHYEFILQTINSYSTLCIHTYQEFRCRLPLWLAWLLVTRCTSLSTWGTAALPSPSQSVSATGAGPGPCQCHCQCNDGPRPLPCHCQCNYGPWPWALAGDRDSQPDSDGGGPGYRHCDCRWHRISARQQPAPAVTVTGPPDSLPKLPDS
jgi:hypothetical protein